VMFGTVTKNENQKLPDLTRHELATLVPILILIFWIGIYPKPFLETMNASVRQVLVQAGGTLEGPASAGIDLPATGAPALLSETEGAAEGAR
jgi:NADH:ubiquinone oxidoreductase subunit 4 (subunit M)